tara:strand:- start:393 stop:635 length:243 start_codon:yes stop_codon:yes gene_type:complete
MTTIALSYSTKILEGSWKVVKKTLQGIMIGYMIARQSEANKAVAQQMINAGEYRQDDYWTLLNDLNARTIQSIHKEFAND